MEIYEDILLMILENQISEAKNSLDSIKNKDELSNSLHNIFKQFFMKNLLECEKLIQRLNPQITSSEKRNKLHAIKLVLTLQIYLAQSNYLEARNLIININTLSQNSRITKKAIEAYNSMQKPKKVGSEKENFVKYYTANSDLKENAKWFVVSTEWFSLWKVKVDMRPCNFGHVLPFDKLWVNETVDSLDSIDNSSIIDVKLQEELEIPTGKKHIVKLPLIENIHYVLIPEEAYTYLKGIYGAKQEIPRHVILSHSDRLKIEVNFTRLTTVYFKSNEMMKKLHFASSNSTFKDICYKIFIHLNLKNSIENLSKVKLWMMNQQTTGFKKLEIIKKKDEKTEISGLVELSLSQKLQEVEFRYYDFLFCDISLNNQFLPIFPIKQKKCKNCSSPSNIVNCSKCDKDLCEKCYKIHKKQSPGCSNKKPSRFPFFSCFCRSKSSKPKKYVNQDSSSRPSKETNFSSLSTYNYTWNSFNTIGLENLGNTCFLNSALQCLAHCEYLSQELLNINLKKREFKYGSKGKLVGAYQELLQEMCGRVKSLAPWTLKNIIEKLAVQFEGFHEQDAQEFLCYFIAGLHDDLNEGGKSSPFPEIKYTNDLNASQESWRRFLSLNKSPLVDLLYGQFKSTLCCPKCKNYSYTFDPFNCISLPIPQNLKNNVEIKFCPYNLADELQYITFPSDQVSNFFDLKSLVHRKIGRGFEDLKIFEIKEKIPYTEVDYSEKFTNSGKVIYEVPAEFNAICFICIGFEGSKIEFPFRALGIDSLITFDVLLEDIHNFLLPIQNDVLADCQDFEVKISTISNGVIQCFVCKKKKCEKVCKVVPTGELIQDYLSGSNCCYIKITLPKITRTNFDYIKYIEFKKQSSFLTIYDCFKAFSIPETLDHNNSWSCPHCKSKVAAQKKLEIFKIPPILIIHLKRFRVFRTYREKIKARINFPVENLDIRDITLGDSKELYDLFAVCNHFGTLSGGHYTATVYNPIKSNWFECNDSVVSKSQGFSDTSAYLFFYRAKNYVKLKD